MPFPVNPCLQVQLNEPTLFTQSAFSLHKLESAKHSSISVIKQKFDRNYLQRCTGTYHRVRYGLIFCPNRCKITLDETVKISLCCSTRMLFNTYLGLIFCPNRFKITLDETVKISLCCSTRMLFNTYLHILCHFQ